MKKTYNVVAISQAIVDVFAKVTPDFFEKHSIEKGTTSHVDQITSQKFLNQLDIIMECAGSAPANTLSALASLGGKCAYISRICKDDLGQIFKRSLDEQGIYFSHSLCDKGMGTGRCISLVTDDGDRTMITYLGTAHEFTQADMDESLIRDTEYILFEAYQFASPTMLEITELALQKGKAAGAKIVLGAANPACLRANRKRILYFIEHYVDIFIGNEDEVRAVFAEDGKTTPTEENLLKHLELCLMTQGERGSTIFSRTEPTFSLPAPIVDVIVDTTGAGDHYLSGFLYGLSRGYSLQDCAKLATLTSGAMLSHFGARAQGTLHHLIDKISTA